MLKTSKYFKHLMSLMLIALLAFGNVTISRAESLYYGIQMGVFTNLQNAEKVQDQIDQTGVEGILITSGTSYYVYYGIYQGYTAASQDIEKARAIISNAFIVKVDSSLASKATISQSAAETSTVTTETSDTTLDTEDTTKTQENDSVDADSETDTEVDDEEDSEGPQSTVPGVLAYNQSLSQDVLMEGVYGTSSMYLSLSPVWEIQEGSYLSLDFATSIPIEFYGSSLTVYLNGTPLKSVFIDTLSDEMQHLEIELPPGLLLEGFNEVRVRTYHRMTEFICEDDGNPANWVVLYDTSLVHIEYKEKMKGLTLSDFPYPFTKNYNQVPVNFAFLTEADMSEVQYQAIHNVAADFGKRNPYKNLEYDVQSLEDYKEDVNGIFIGSAVPDQYLNQVSDLWGDRDIPDDYFALLSLDDSTYMLFIISKNDTYLELMSKILMDDDLIEQMNEVVFAIDMTDQLPIPGTSSDEIFTLKELGYSDVYTEGAKTNTSNYFVDIPDNWHIDNGAQVVVKARYAKVMNLDQSTVTLLINNIPTGSYILSAEADDDATFVFNIPKELYDEKSLSVSVKFSLEGDFDCSSGGSNTNFWTYVSNQSYIYLPHVEKTTYALEDYPAPFIGDNDLNNLNLVYQDKPSNDMMKLGLEILSYIAHETDNESDFTITYGEIPNDKNNIVLATLDSEIIKNLNDDFNMPYDYDTAQFVNPDSLLVLNGYNNQLNTIQILSTESSPYKTLVVSGPNESHMLTASRFLSDFEFVGFLYGDVLVVDSQGFYQTFDTSGLSEEDTTIELASLVNNADTRVSYSGAQTFVIVMALLVLGIVVLIVVIKKNRRTRL